MFQPGVLKSLRIGKKLSRAFLAQFLTDEGEEVTRATVFNWEKGRTEPRASQVYFLARLLGVDMKRFFT